MRLLLTILLVGLLSSCKAQSNAFITWYQVQSVTQLKNYGNPTLMPGTGTANGIRVIGSPDVFYLLCSSCTADEVTVFQGYAFRKWRKFEVGGSETDSIANNRIDSLLATLTPDELDYRDIDQLDSSTFVLIRPNDTRDTVTFKWGGFGDESFGVDSIWRVPGVDSFYYSLHGINYAIKDSTGGGSDTNFATSNLTFTGDRTHTLGTNYLKLVNTSSGYFEHITGDQTFVSDYSRLMNNAPFFTVEHYDATNNITTSILSTLSSGGQVKLSAQSGVGNSQVIASATDGVTLFNGDGKILLLNVNEYTDNAAAVAAGAATGTVYRTGDILKIVH